MGACYESFARPQILILDSLHGLWVVLPYVCMFRARTDSSAVVRTILQDELPQVQKACEKRYPGGKLPKISIIVCGKRHHTRFYPTREEDAAGKQMNPPNGTVVDRWVTMEKGWDFYLQAHFALQGTARPTHYVVIYDKNDMNADQMEAMVNSPVIP